MKGKKLLTCLLYGAIACCIAVSGAGCIVTAFSFDTGFDTFGHGIVPMVDMQAVVLWSAALSLLSAFVFSKKRSWVALPVMAAAVLGVLAATGMLQELHELAYRISIFYNKAYHWGVIPKPVNMEEIMHSSMIFVVEWPKITGGLVTVCALVVLAVNWVLCGERPAALAVVAGFLPLAVCCVVTDTVPDEKYLFPLLAGIILVMLTATVRRYNEKAGVKLTALLMVPVLLASMLFSYLLPRESYEQQSEAVLQTMLSWVQDLPFIVQGPDGKLEISITAEAPDDVDLAGAGPIAQAKYPVMDVVSTVSQRIYLRGQSFDTYDGKSWTNSLKSSCVEGAWPQKGRDEGLVTIRTRSRLGYRFVPYYTKGNRALEKGTVENPDGEQEYSYMLIDPVVDSVGVLPSMSIVCRELDENTKKQAAEYAMVAVEQAGGKYDNAKVREKWAACILDYVRSSATYSRNIPQMPEGAEDFALWFLENSDTGYCVHFATAAAVLLRAAGVPARYVTGYAVDAKAGQKVTVTADKSHAWVEYLNDDNIWTVLDATPGEWMNEQPATDPTATEEPTQQPTEESPTAPAPTNSGESRPTDGPTETRPSTVPGQTGGAGEQEREADRTALWTALKWLAGLLGAAAVLALQYTLRRHLRRKKRVKGDPNRQALYRYREAKRMAWLVRGTVPEELVQLAEKAKFSQHTLTEEELARMDAYLEQAQQALSKKPWLLRLALRLIWAV